ncbi:iron-sulfur cluster assembly accessory protein [bacterium]|nr:iron-sulfur cluster assembly accessory protein [bacterium]
MAPTAAPGAAPAPTATAVADAVSLTKGAATEVRRLIAAEGRQGQGLRLGVAGGGCSGLVYKVEFDTRRDGDLVIAQDGFEVYLDRKSAIYLRGITVDHQSGLGGRGFQFRNPNATNTCGCGESFAV